jgi:hypothetical protein
MAVYQLPLRRYLVRAEDRLQDHTADGHARTASVDGEILVALAEVVEVVEADSTTGD